MMGEISNNVLAALLIVAILVTSVGIWTLSRIPTAIYTGAATGVTNLTVESLASIRLIRNVSDFGQGLPNPSTTLDLWSNATNTNGFNNGSEGNGTNYGSGTHVYPFVVENDGNDDTTCVKVSGSDASTFIGGKDPVFQVAAHDNETGSCHTNLHTEWQNVSGSEVTVCEELHTEQGGGGANTIRLHWHIGLPYDATPTTHSNTITVSAYGSC
ncbi:MAG: hypothetical protein J7K72_03445 [Candidatus Aenigmarchaeota archaeon]|nr:hypothetical protein [Candidatus Aenigmarchaeota archaeon]